MKTKLRLSCKVDDRDGTIVWQGKESAFVAGASLILVEYFRCNNQDGGHVGNDQGENWITFGNEGSTFVRKLNTEIGVVSGDCSGGLILFTCKSM